MENRVYKAFDQIRADEKVVAHTKQFIAAKSMEKQQGFRSVRKVLAACATLFILMGTSGLYFANVSPVSYISIDVNPSIELELNCFDKIIGAYAYNDNGREILDMVSVKGMKAEEAVDTIVTSEAMQPYLADNADLTFTIASDNADKEQNLYNLLENCNSIQIYIIQWIKEIIAINIHITILRHEQFFASKVVRTPSDWCRDRPDIHRRD